MSGTLSITRATASHAAAVAELIATAFHTLDVACWLVPDPARRVEILPANFRIWVDHALAHGQLHLADNGAAAAVWFPRNPTMPLPEPANYEERLAAACREANDRFRHLDALFDRHHPTQQPHHHLAFLAVHPKRQRQGLGGALLRHHHNRLDAYSLGAYLEASSEGSRDLYQRHGYRDLNQIMRLPDGTPLYPMWRPTARERRQNGEL
jgi:ribosomal protein S18 acetylase RimI-like enzyme